MSKFYQLKVSEIKNLTSDSVCISFDIPENLSETFKYKSGQYVTLKFNLNGKEERRSYSICSSPTLDKSLQVGVKRIDNGLVSNHINDHLKVGNVIEVMPPEGRFIVDVDANNQKAYYLFAAGSGITPIISILKTVLDVEKQSLVYLIYGNRNQESIMFKDVLQQLQNNYKEQLVITHCLSKPKGSFWSSKNKMEHLKGRIDSKTIKWFLNTNTSNTGNNAYYICGPGTMIDNTKQALTGLNFPEDNIYIESFGDGNTNDTSNDNNVKAAKLTALLDDETVEITVPEGKTILRALIDNKYDPPYSCEGGVCSTCICMLKKGKVHMHNNISLTDSEVTQGYILSCQSVPLTEELEVEFE